jgi:hypothetical protein
MNKLYSILIVLSSGLNTLGQTINKSEVEYIVGTEYTMASGDWDEVAGPSGNGVVFDFTRLDNSSIDTLRIQDPSNTGNGASFATSNIATVQGMNVEFLTQGASGVEKVVTSLDIAGAATDVVYDNPETYWNYPITMSDFYLDTYSAETVIGGLATYSINGSGAGVVDAYGSLILPEGTIDNVLRVKVIKSYSQALTILTEITDLGSNDDTLYYFFAEGFHLPILTLSKSVGGFLDASTYSYFVNPALFVNVNEKDVISAYPNPCSSNQINFSNLLNFIGGELKIFDLSGKEVLSTKVKKDKMELRHELSNGNYMVKIVSDNKSVSLKVVIE